VEPAHHADEIKRTGLTGTRGEGALAKGPGKSARHTTRDKAASGVYAKKKEGHLARYGHLGICIPKYPEKEVNSDV